MLLEVSVQNKCRVGGLMDNTQQKLASVVVVWNKSSCEKHDSKCIWQNKKNKKGIWPKCYVS